MNLVVATIPDDPAELAGWLERRLVGLELDGLVAELAAIHPPHETRLSLRQVLGVQIEPVCKSGLSCLSRGQLKLLLTNPRLLLELQEEVLTHGSSYWDQIAHTIPAVQRRVEVGRNRLPPRPEPIQPRPVVQLPQTKTVSPAAAAPARSAWYVQPWLVSLATAAAVLLAVGVWLWSRPEPTTVAGWGWSPGTMKADAKPKQYLNALADAAEEWFAKKPDDAAGLAQRIGQMRQGCSQLILAKHEPLSKEDRDWLIERCKAWAAKFDRALANLEAGEEAGEVRRQMDDAIKSLVGTLREQAKKVT